MSSQVERIHSLDALRATMMILGIVLHSTETYPVQANDPWPKDPLTTHIFLDYLEDLIHVFRMPIFFLIAGFFGSLLFYQRGAPGMIRNRVARILLPFVVFLFVLSPIINLALGYTMAAFSENGNALAIARSTFSGWGALVPRSTFHLWFLYYLVLITITSVLLALLLEQLPMVKHRITQSFNWVLQKPVFRLFFFAFLTVVILLVIGKLSGGTFIGKFLNGKRHPVP